MCWTPEVTLSKGLVNFKCNIPYLLHAYAHKQLQQPSNSRQQLPTLRVQSAELYVHLFTGMLQSHQVVLSRSCSCICCLQQHVHCRTVDSALLAKQLSAYCPQ